MLTINSNIKQFIKVLEKEIALQNKALVSALNKTAAQGRTAADYAIRDEYNISKTNLNKKDPKTFRKRLDIEKANERKKISKIVGLGVGLSIKYFNAKQTAEGVSFELRKGKVKTIKSAFGPEIKRLGFHVFQRLGKTRLPIGQKRTGYQAPLLTTGVAKMLDRKEVKTKVIKYIVANFPRILQDQIHYYTQLKKG